jgi:hypothetical protein
MKNCRKCNIELTEENKVKKENLCKPCNKIIREERKKAKQPVPNPINDIPITVTYIKDANDQILECRVCSTLLTDLNKIKREIICRECCNAKKKEYHYRIKNNIPPPPKIINDKCSICSTLLTDENRKKNSAQCKTCRNENRKISMQKNIETEKFVGEQCSKCSAILTPETQQKGRRICKPCVNKASNESKRRNKENVKKRNKIYYENNKDKIKEYYKEHYTNNKDSYLNNNRKWREENKDILNEQARERCKVDENYRLKKALRTRIYSCLKKDKPTMEYVGCDLEFLKQWLESNFKEDMTFENYGSNWHVDHVIPCSKFDLTNEEEIKNCFRWTNLQPLNASENMSKHNIINSDEVKSHYKKVKSFAKKYNITLPKFDYKKYIEIEI